MSDITLTASIRSNLLSLQNTTRLLDTTSERLSTGKRVNSALDNPNSFFTARGLSNRAGDLTSRKDSIGQSISLLQATDKSINAITTLVEQAKAIAQQAEEAATGAVTSTTGVSSVSSQAATLSGVTTVSTEAIAAATGSVTSIATKAHVGAATTFSTLSSAQATNAGAAAAGISTIHSVAGNNITNSATDTLVTVFGATTLDQISIQVGATGQRVVVSADDTLDTIKTKVEAGLDNVTVTIDLTQDELEFSVAGGGTLIFTDLNGDALLADLGLQDSASAAIASGIATSAFATLGTDSDLVSYAFGVTAGDVLTLEVTGGEGTTNATAFTVGSKTVAQLVTYIGNLDSSITATYNTTTDKIDITSSNTGEQITLTSTVAATFGFDGGPGVLASGIAQSFTADQSDSDTLISAFAATATDVLTFDYNGSSTNFTIGNNTIADLVTSITNIDSDITATYNTTSNKIEVTSGVGGAALTFTNTVGTPLTELALVDSGSTTVVSGTATTFKSNANTSDLATTAFGLDASATFTVAVAGAGSATIALGSQTVAELVTAIGNVDSKVTASFNTTTSKIDITSPTGTQVTFTDAAAVAQVDTVTLSGYADVNDVHAVTVNGTTVSYTVVANDLTVNGDGTGGTATNAQALGNIATKLAAALDANGTVGALINATADTAAGTVAITAVTAGTTLNVSATNVTDTADTPIVATLTNTTPSSNAATKVDTLTVVGNVNTGEVVSYTVNDTTYSYTVTGLEADDDAIASALAALIQADSNVATAVATATSIVITGTGVGIDWASSASVTSNETAASATSARTTSAVASGAVAGLTLDGVFSSVTSGTAVTFTDTTVAVTSGDLLTAGFSGVAVNDAFTISTVNGGTTTFTVGASTTVADLVTAIGNADSALTASYNTSTSKIDVTGTDNTVVTFTDLSSSGLVSDLGLLDVTGNASITSGTAVTYGLTTTLASAEVTALNTDYQNILEQIDTLLNDASYKGTNLLKGGNDFVVKFNADGSSSLTLTGLDLGVTGNTNLKFTLNSNGYDFNGTGIATALTDTQNAINHLRSVASTFGTGLGIIQTREAFTSELVSVLQSGADKLVNANLEEESANLLALQTRQALGIQSLSIANQSQQSVLSLFR